VGAWDTKTFDNDDAMDWLDELAQTSDLSLCEQCLNAEEIQAYYLEAPECVRILCSAEVLAALIFGCGSAANTGMEPRARKDVRRGLCPSR